MPAAFYIRCHFFLEIPFPKLETRTSWLDVFPTESVRLSCEMDGSSDWMFTWYRDGREVHAGQGVSFDQDATVLSINSASASHCGQYSCSGKHKQRPVSSEMTSGLQLDVYGEAKSIIYSFTWFSKGRFHWAAVTVQDVAAGEYRVLGVGHVTDKTLWAQTPLLQLTWGVWLVNLMVIELVTHVLANSIWN